MPEAFYAQKREEILDTAQRIAMEKPLAHVSMKDLIRACGVSQGAIYHYFSGLDEIWLALVERFYQSDDVLGHLKAVFAGSLSARETVMQCLCVLCENMRKTIPAYGKLIIELNTLVQANPGQYASWVNRDQPPARPDEMLALFQAWCVAQLHAGAVCPRVSMDQLAMQLCAAYLGLRYHAVAVYLQPALAGMGLDAYLDMQLQSWQMSFLYLLGLEGDNESA